MSTERPTFLTAEKKKGFFADRGPLTKQEQVLARFLDPYVEKQRIAPDPEDPAWRLINKNQIKEDNKQVRAFKNTIRERDERLSRSNPENFFEMRRGQISEQAIIYGMQAGKWFGKGSEVKVASQYDDLFNGVDCIVDFDSAKQLAIGIDATTSKDKIAVKLKKIRNLILKGSLVEVRYFNDDYFTGTLHDVPLVVVGMSSEANGLLARLVYDLEMTEQYDPGDTLDKKDKAKIEIAKNTIQILVLLEIEMQLQVFLEFALKIGEVKLAAKLESDLKRVQEVLKAKLPRDDKESQRLKAEVKNDPVFRSMAQVLKSEFTNWEEPDILVAKIK